MTHQLQLNEKCAKKKLYSNFLEYFNKLLHIPKSNSAIAIVCFIKLVSYFMFSKNVKIDIKCSTAVPDSLQEIVKEASFHSLVILKSRHSLHSGFLFWRNFFLFPHPDF